MKNLTLMPSYCKEFHCIADACKKSCCRAGWEIDIDDVTLEKYKNTEGELGRELSDCITVSEDGSKCFALDSDGVCPFLDGGGLCRLILEKGEDMLCDICREHPRFYNFLSGFTDMGIGLCCEEACRLIVESDAPMELILAPADDDGNDEDCEDSEDDMIFTRQLLAARAEILNMLSDRTLPLWQRLSDIAEIYSVPLNDECFINDTSPLEFSKTLEPFDNTYIPMICGMIESFWKIKNADSSRFSRVLDNLAEYFIFRYYTKAYELQYDERTYVKFVIFCIEFIRLMLEYENPSNDGEVIDALCNFSNQIEYSEENVSALLSYFESDMC